MKLRIFLAVLFLALTSHGLRADIVHLDNGRKLEGEVIIEKDTVKVITRMGTVTLAKERVVRIEKTAPKKGPAAAYKEKAASIKDGDADAHYKLAVWCRKNRLYKQVAIELNKAITIDPDHEKARAALNYVKMNGKWVKARRGMVYVGGEWLKPEAALDRGKEFYKLEKYEEAAKVFQSAAKVLRRGNDRTEARYYVGLTAERLGNWDEAKAAHKSVMNVSTFERRYEAKARREIIAASTAGMYLVKDYVGKEDIFSIDTDDTEGAEKLTGMQSLKNPRVMRIALRDRCFVHIEKGKKLLTKAKGTDDGTSKGGKKAWALLDQAEAQFNDADKLVKDISRGFLVECVKRRLAVIDRRYTVMVARVQGQLYRLGTLLYASEQRKLASGLITDLDQLLVPIKVMEKLARRYPDDLSQQLVRCQVMRDSIRSLQVQLKAFIGE